MNTMLNSLCARNALQYIFINTNSILQEGFSCIVLLMQSYFHSRPNNCFYN